MSRTEKLSLILASPVLFPIGLVIARVWWEFTLWAIDIFLLGINHK